jgi:hypothetical protein
VSAIIGKDDVRLPRTIHVVAAWIATLVGAAGWFLLTTATLGRANQFVALAAAASAAAAVSAMHLGDRTSRVSVSSSATAAAGGVLAFSAAPLLILSQRASDAPSGSETLLFSVVALGFAAVLVSLFSAQERPGAGAVAGAVVAAAGAASLLANWERPSSFSPLVRWPGREAVMLLAALLFAAGTLLVLRAERRSGAAMRSVAVISAALVAVALAVPALASGATAQQPVPELLIMSLAYALFVTGWLALSGRSGIASAASPLFVVPAALTSLIIAEKIAGVRGTDPIVWAGATAGIAMSIAGAVALLGSRRDTSPTDAHREPRGRALRWWGMGAALLGAASLALPAISQAAEGTVGTQEAFSAQWIVAGYQSGAGWAVFASGVCALVVSLVVSRRGRVREWALAALAGLTSAAASAFLGDSTFATWNSWVPGDIQHAYGTEYARLTVTAIVGPGRVFSAVLSVGVIAACVAFAIVARAKPKAA